MQNDLVAEVIVDVPSAQTDRAYSYSIPLELEEDATVGSRVQVSFGKRHIQGYIVGVKKDAFTRKLKPLVEVLDFTPSLTEELVQLGQYMANKYLCHTITSLNAMVPAILKGKTQKLILPHPHHMSPRTEIDCVLQEKGRLEWKKAVESYGIKPATLRRWVQEERIRVEESVTDRVTVKKTMWVWASHTPEEMIRITEKIPKSATQQKRVLSFFSACSEQVPLLRVLAELQVTRSVIKKLVEKNWLEWEEREEYRDPFGTRDFKKTTPLTLTKEQLSILSQLISPIKDEYFHSFLLQGVTGSGKTEIYLQAIERVLAMGKEAIVLVPEISLTPQMVYRFKGRFGEQVAVLHSRLSSGERYDEWRKIRHQTVKVVVGARSAIFAPFLHLGIIIIDEEHESSYKQEENPKYDAREIALWRAKRHNAVLVLGSATPGIDSYHAARQGSHTQLFLSERVHGRPFPEVHVVDMRSELKSGNRTIFSNSLQVAIGECTQKGEQVVLFLNRRGFATFVMCRDCGEVIKCPHCDISLTLHQTNNTLRCHYCGFASKMPKSCPECNSQHIRHFGTGTQRVEQDLLQRFPGIRVIRMDVDTTSKKDSHEKLLSAFSRGEADVLLGTQMIAKGLDFPNVTLVGVIAADSMLHLPDYRSSERTFQLLVQVSGRAGRHEKPGKVIIQTYSANHYSVEKASKYEMESFYDEECMLRKRNRYPPYCGLYTLLLSHSDRVRLMKVAQQMAQYLKKAHSEGCEILGPVSATIPKIKDRYRLQVVIKVQKGFQDLLTLKRSLRELQQMAINQELRLSIDQDSIWEG